ncbi:MAG: prolipoprotein diacylglyceryl transferase [Microscillaceae bacterium]|nr:prolipoprotein diacylglyceryl transferase [Microscillaceae bacterium]
MLNILNYILWDVRPEIFSTDYVTIRWYGLLFASGFLVGQWIIARIFKIEGKPEKDLETLMIYMVLATIVGARLGHCLFYQPDHYLKNPIEILYIWEGGLASHGAAIGILLALYLYSRKRIGQSFLWVVDRIVIVVALGGSFIRFGNLMNSEIIGKPSDMPAAFVFAHSLDEAFQDKRFHVLDIEKKLLPDPDTIINGITHTPMDITIKFDKQYVQSDPLNPPHQQLIVNKIEEGFEFNNEVNKHYYINQAKLKVRITEDNTSTICNFQAWGIPRHPAQLYESISSLLIFLFLLWLYYRKKEQTPHGLLFGLFMILIFFLRFIYEFFKENQVEFENDLVYNMGQLLSIPAVIVGVVVLVMALRRPKINPLD